jgi:DNA-binding MarR family transcriptional regulator
MTRYNTSQKILEELADAESRPILFSSVTEERSAAELSEILHIPLSSVYKKLDKLQHLGLITVARTVMDANRKRVKMYKSNIAEANIHIKNHSPDLESVPDPILVANDSGSSDEGFASMPQNEFDITRRIIEELGSTRSRSVLFSIRDSAKNARVISVELRISLSAVSDALARLEYLGLVEKIVADGNETGTYRSRIAEANITISGSEPTLALVEN